MDNVIPDGWSNVAPDHYVKVPHGKMVKTSHWYVFKEHGKWRILPPLSINEKSVVMDTLESAITYVEMIGE